MFLENVFVREDFCQPERKQVTENKQAFWALTQKPTPQRILDIVNLKLSMHLVIIYVCPIISFS